MPNGLVIPGGVTFPILAPDGSAAAPSYSFQNSTNTGIYQAGNALRFASAGTQFMLGTANDLQMQVPITLLGGLAQIGASANLFYAGRSGDYCFWTDYAFSVNPTTGWALTLRVDAPLCWGAGTLGGSPDTGIVRLAAASIRQGLAPSASPISQTFTIGEASRPGTDVNVGGSSGTLRSGLGTGTGTASSLLFQTPDLVGAGSTTQTYTTRLTVATTQITATVRISGTEIVASGFLGAGASGYAIQQTAAADGLYVNGAWGVGGSDNVFARLAAASMRLGLAPSATPVAQTFTVGEASRPGTDSNVGGASGTFRSGLGTGTGTASSLLFQTPNLVASGSTTQTYATRLTVATAGITVEGSTPFSAVSTSTFSQVGTVSFGGDGNAYFGFNASYLSVSANVAIGFTNTPTSPFSTVDTAIARLGAASLRLGLAPSATPVNQTFTIGEASRAGTDLNAAGANGIIRSGLGTGNAAGSSLFFQTPTAVGSSTLAQGYTTRLTLSALGAVFDIPDQTFRINNQATGAGAAAGTLTNAPVAGNPSFWLPINVGGTVYFFPGW